MLLAILDTETSSLSPDTGHLLEVAVAIYDTELRCQTRARSWLVAAPSNEAERVNGIPEAMLRAHGAPLGEVLVGVDTMLRGCDAVVAYNAAFDRQWFDAPIQQRRWVCAMDDIAWPKSNGSRSLMAVALAHGVGVVAAHRALDDVLTLLRLFERVQELGHDLDAMLVRAMRPKVKVAIADTTFDEARNAKAKELGFRWEKPLWVKTMAKDDVGGLPFAVREVGT